MPSTPETPLLPHPLDVAYFLGVSAASPFWLLKTSARKKVLAALRDRLASPPIDTNPVGTGVRGQGSGVSHEETAERRTPKAESPPHPPTVLMHAVSLGEINATRTLVDELLSRHSTLRVVVSATTETGFARAKELYKDHPPHDRVSVSRYPLDFTGATTRFLAHHRPDVVVLMELELWPNFLRICRKSDIPVLLVNGRLTTHSLQRYRLIRPIARRMLRSLSLLCVQDETYRDRFIASGADPARIQITGTMKFDTAQLTPDPEKVESLRTAMGLSQGDLLWVAGSTGPGEEALLLPIYRRLLEHHPTLKLAIIPRKPERFDEVAQLIRDSGYSVLRRSTGTLLPPAAASNGASPTRNAILLGDTLGELRAFYALATVVFVGRSLVDLGPRQHGSDMIEPAALALPILTGPHTHNFADAMHLLRQSQAIEEVATPEDLYQKTHALLSTPEARQTLAANARATVTKAQGATTRHADKILNLLPTP